MQRRSPLGMRALNEPLPVDVRVDSDARPMAIKLEGRWWKVSSIEEVWRVDDEWWRDVSIGRTFYRVLAEDGRPVNVFLDEIGGCWYRLRGSV